MLPESDGESRRGGAGKTGRGASSDTRFTEDGLILPRKPHNPCLESSERQSLHKELVFTQKRGISVLNQKSELQRAMERHRDQQTKKQEESNKLTQQSSFEKVLEARAKRLEQLDEPTPSPEGSQKPEFLQVHAKLRARMDS